MIPTKLVVGAAIVAVLGVAIWRYGEARYESGIAETVAVQAKAAVALHQRLDQERRAAAARLVTVSAQLQAERRQHEAHITALRADASFRAWHDGVIHPLGVDIIWLPERASGDGDGVSAGRGADRRPVDARASATSTDADRLGAHQCAVAPVVGGHTSGDSRGRRTQG